MVRRSGLLVLLMLLPATLAAATPQVQIDLAHNNRIEGVERGVLTDLLRQYDLSEYTFSNHVIISQGATNHSFPVITLNVRYARTPDALLGSYIHENLHWYLQQHNAARMDAIRRLRQTYPNAPAAYPAGGGTAVSTYGHLVVCYLEMQALRKLIGPQRTTAVINETPWYTWIWSTVVEDESTIGALVKQEGLDLP